MTRTTRTTRAAARAAPGHQDARAADLQDARAPELLRRSGYEEPTNAYDEYPEKLKLFVDVHKGKSLVLAKNSRNTKGLPSKMITIEEIASGLWVQYQNQLEEVKTETPFEDFEAAVGQLHVLFKAAVGQLDVLFKLLEAKGGEANSLEDVNEHKHLLEDVYKHDIADKQDRDVFRSLIKSIVGFCRPLYDGMIRPWHMKKLDVTLIGKPEDILQAATATSNGTTSNETDNARIEADEESETVHVLQEGNTEEETKEDSTGGTKEETKEDQQEPDKIEEDPAVVIKEAKTALLKTVNRVKDDFDVDWVRGMGGHNIQKITVKDGQKILRIVDIAIKEVATYKDIAPENWKEAEAELLVIRGIVLYKCGAGEHALKDFGAVKELELAKHPMPSPDMVKAAMMAGRPIRVVQDMLHQIDGAKYKDAGHQELQRFYSDFPTKLQEVLQHGSFEGNSKWSKLINEGAETIESTLEKVHCVLEKFESLVGTLAGSTMLHEMKLYLTLALTLTRKSENPALMRELFESSVHHQAEMCQILGERAENVPEALEETVASRNEGRRMSVDTHEGNEVCRFGPEASEAAIEMMSPTYRKLYCRVLVCNVGTHHGQRRIAETALAALGALAYNQRKKDPASIEAKRLSEWVKVETFKFHAIVTLRVYGDGYFSRDGIWKTAAKHYSNAIKIRLDWVGLIPGLNVQPQTGVPGALGASLYCGEAACKMEQALYELEYARELYENALELYKNALACDPNCATAMQGIACAYSKLGNHDKACAEYVLCIRKVVKTFSRPCQIKQLKDMLKRLSEELKELKPSEKKVKKRSAYTAMLCFSLKEAVHNDSTHVKKLFQLFHPDMFSKKFPGLRTESTEVFLLMSEAKDELGL